jgi:hypothetical protein
MRQPTTSPARSPIQPSASAKKVYAPPPRGIDAFDIVVLIAFLSLSMWIVLVLIVRKTPEQVWTGTNGLYIGDQMQYLGWIRYSARHLLIGDPFVTTPSASAYLNPCLFISGLLARAGLGAWLAYLLWVPISAVALFFAVRALAHKLIDGTAQRRCALVIALFYVSPAAAIASVLHSEQSLFLTSFAREIWPGMYLWGYPLTAIAVASMVAALLSYARDRADGRLRGWAPCSALLCAWLQPWQGATILVIVVVSETYLWLRGSRNTMALPAVTLAATAAPLGYYLLLSHLDGTWALAGRVDRINSLPFWALAFTVLPLALCALFAYWRCPVRFEDVAVRVWPIGAFFVLWLMQLSGIGTFPKHALQGLSVPLAVLAVIGIGRLRRGDPAVRVILGSLVVALLVVPPLVWELDQATSTGVSTIFGAEPYLINKSEQAALTYLDRDPAGGAVLSTVYLGQIVPAETGRNTWVGIASWTPNYESRVDEANRLFLGQLTPSHAIHIVLSSRARFLLADCGHRANLSSALSSILESEQHFGCATLYQVK